MRKRQSQPPAFCAAAFVSRVAEARVVDGAALLGGPATLDEA
ncbi:hypothetical protein ABZZ74_39615 [Streptomyces sp. NPDC006476]